MAQRVDSCPPALRDLRDVVVAAVLAELLRQVAPTPIHADTTRAAANDPAPEAAA